MFLAILGAWFSAYVCDYGVWVTWLAMIPGAIIGCVMAARVTMMEMPQMVGLLNAFGGLASAVEAIGLFIDEEAGKKKYFDWDYDDDKKTWDGKYVEEDGDYDSGKPEQGFGVKYYGVQTFALHLALIVGSITFFGSIVACCKLLGKP